MDKILGKAYNIIKEDNEEKNEIKTDEMNISFFEKKDENIEIINDEKKEIIKIKNLEVEVDKIINYDEIKDLMDYDIILKTCSYAQQNEFIMIIRNMFLEENVKKYKPEELTPDFLPTVDALIKFIDNKDIDQLEKYKNENIKIYNREMVQRVKCLSLYKMNKNIMTNTYELNNRDRVKLQEIMWSYNDVKHEDIIKEFNDKACEELFDYKVDMSNLPIYER